MQVVSPGICDDASPFFCTKNDVVMQTEMSGGHRQNPGTLPFQRAFRGGGADPGVRTKRAPLANLLTRLRRADKFHPESFCTVLPTGRGGIRCGIGAAWPGLALREIQHSSAVDPRS